jgi:hypothetical protein
VIAVYRSSSQADNRASSSSGNGRDLSVSRTAIDEVRVIDRRREA